MNIVPTALIGAKYPEYLERISKISKKWEKRTKCCSNPWPQDGTFDAAVCDDMETRVRDHKNKDKSKKRKEKGELELKILNMFREQGDRYRKYVRQGLSNLKRKQNQVDNQTEPKFKDEAAGVYPSLTGVLNFTGDLDTLQPRPVFHTEDPKQLSPIKEADASTSQPNTSQQASLGAIDDPTFGRTPNKEPPPKYCSND